MMSTDVLPQARRTSAASLEETGLDATAASAPTGMMGARAGAAAPDGLEPRGEHA